MPTKKKNSKSATKTPEVVFPDQATNEGYLVTLQNYFEQSVRSSMDQISEASQRTLKNLEKLLELHETIADRTEELLQEEEERAHKLGILDREDDD
jgi:hypothetical protein